MINILVFQLYNMDQIRASSSNCTPLCDQWHNACIVFTLIMQHDLFILKKCTQNIFERKVNEYGEAHG